MAVGGDEGKIHMVHPPKGTKLGSLDDFYLVTKINDLAISDHSK